MWDTSKKNEHSRFLSLNKARTTPRRKNNVSSEECFEQWCNRGLLCYHLNLPRDLTKTIFKILEARDTRLLEMADLRAFLWGVKGYTVDGKKVRWVSEDYDYPSAPLNWVRVFVAYADGSVGIDFLHSKKDLLWGEENETPRAPIVQGEALKREHLEEASVPYMLYVNPLTHPCTD